MQTRRGQNVHTTRLGIGSCGSYWILEYSIFFLILLLHHGVTIIPHQIESLLFIQPEKNPLAIFVS